MFAFLGITGTLCAQPSGNPGVNLCEVAAAPAIVRAEGIAELAGDILITCVNGTAPGVSVTASEVVMNVFLRGSVDITNDVGFGAGANITDAVLVVNENNCASPSAVGGRFGGCGAPNANVQDPQLARQTATDRVDWLSVRVPVPGGPGSGGPNPETTTLRITGLRVRASQNGVPHAATIPDTPISASVSIAAQGFSIPNSGVVSVALPILGLMISKPGGAQGEQCRAGSLPLTFTLREGFGAALRVAGPPSFFPDVARTESGYFRPGHPGRILLRFSNIPQGVEVTLPRIVETGDPAVEADAVRIQWVEGAGADGSGGAVSIQGGTVTFSSPPGGAAFAVYEVVDANPDILEALPIAATVSWSVGASLDVVRMSAYPAPLSAVTAASFAAPEPRFLDAAQPGSLFTLAPCRSTLLFPYAVQSAGGSTTIVLDNLTGVLPGTTPQQAACVLRFRGQNPAPEHTTPPIGPGQQAEVALAGIAPAFSGHVVAECEFEAAAGKAIFTRGGLTFENDAERLASNGAGAPPEPLALLIPYAVSTSGFDTFLAIANPTLDVPGLPAQPGSCRIDYFGQNAPPSQLSAPLPPGGELAFPLSTGNPAMGIAGAPNFSGYVAAVCEFPFASGFAAVSGPGAGFGFPAEPFAAPLVVFPPEEGPNPPDLTTHLLIPYASSRAGDETVLAITNASQDLLGTIPRSGSCILDYRGDQASSAPPPQTLLLAAGEQAVFPLSQGDPARTIAPAPGFRGYLTLACDFPRARAVAMVTAAPGGSSEGSLALVAEPFDLPRDPTPAPLFWPYLASNAAEDRVVALASTSIDGFGTTPVNAACSLAFHGIGAPGPTGVPMPAGAVRTFLLSRGLPALGVPAAPGSQGFLLSSCEGGLIRAVEYRVAPPVLKPFCELDENPGVQSSDVIALSAMLGQGVAVGSSSDPNGDGIVTSADVQYCNSLTSGVQGPLAPAPKAEAEAPAPGASRESADLRAAWEASPATARPQRRLSLTATVTNIGPATASNAIATVYPPDALLGPRAPASCSYSAGAWTCELGALAPDQAATLEFSGKVATDASSALVATVEAASAAFDPNPGDNLTPIAIPLDSQVDLAPSAYLLPQRPAPGEQATLTISLTNRGPARATDVQLTAELAPELEIVEAPAGCSRTGDGLACRVGLLNAGRTRAFLIPTRIVSNGTASGFLAIVSGSSSTSEHAPENNTFVLRTY